MDAKTKGSIRKAYYTASLDEFLAKFLATDEPSEAALAEVYAYLEILEGEKNAIKQKMSIFDVKGIKLPGVSELTNLSEEKKLAMQKWEAEREADYAKAGQIMAEAQNLGLQAHTSQYLNYGFQLACLQNGLDLYRIWKDQCYRARIVDLMDRFGCSRAESEERAKLTVEYREYKRAVLFRELIEEVIMLCKKKYAIM